MDISLVYLFLLKLEVFARKTLFLSLGNYVDPAIYFSSAEEKIYFRSIGESIVKINSTRLWDIL